MSSPNNNKADNHPCKNLDSYPPIPEMKKEIHETREKLKDIIEIIESLERRIDESEKLIEESIAMGPNFKNEIRDELSTHAKEVAVVKEWVRIFEENVNELKEDFRDMADANKEIKNMLHQHIVEQASSKTKMMAGLITAGLSSVGTLAILIWGVVELIGKLSV